MKLVHNLQFWIDWIRGMIGVATGWLYGDMLQLGVPKRVADFYLHHIRKALLRIL